jgi:four helix bundle protein
MDMNETDKLIRSHRELKFYQKAFEAAMKVFEVTKRFPVEERYSLTDQDRRASRSTCANITEAWRKRRDEGAFLSKLSDAESEAAEVQTWIEFSVRCQYLDKEFGNELYKAYDEIIGKLVTMIRNPKPWILKNDRHE